MRTVMMLGLLVCLLQAAELQAEPYKLAAGDYPVSVLLDDWVDPARNDRKVPWKLYLPDSAEPVPVVIFSNGLGGSREGAAYLGEHLASHGYAAFHIQHPGTDASLFQGDGLQAALQRGQNPRAARERYADVGFAVGMIKDMNAAGRLKGRLQVDAIGISGHSYGALTTLVVAGAQNAALGQQFALPELRGAFAMSPAARGGEPGQMFRDLLMPVFHLTGTEDDSPLGDLKPEDRQLPFQAISNVDQYLLVMADAVHATFSGRQVQTDPLLARHHQLICMAAVAFWDETLRNDEAARRWLRDGGFAGELGPGDVFVFEAAEPEN